MEPPTARGMAMRKPDIVAGEHVVRLLQFMDFAQDEYGFNVHCSCGHRERVVGLRRDAERLALSHVKEGA